MQAVIQYILFLFTGTLLHAQATPEMQLSGIQSEIHVALVDDIVPLSFSKGIENRTSTYFIGGSEEVSTTNHCNLINNERK